MRRVARCRTRRQGEPDIIDLARCRVGAATYSDWVSPHSETLLDLSLARTSLTRDLSDREGSAGLDAALADPQTRVVQIHGDRARVVELTEGAGDASATAVRWRLNYLSPSDAGLVSVGQTTQPGGADAPVLVLLGRNSAGIRYVAQISNASADEGPTGSTAADGGDAELGSPEYRTLREVGSELDDVDTGVFTSAMALAHWHRRAPFCPGCGTATIPGDGGWVRRCPADGSEHYPRTDAAIIVAVTDSDDRLLLAQGANWVERRMSLLAGFVEAGETFEAAVAREVGEEVGVALTDIAYRGNQPWPFPASLMIGFTARAVTTDLRLQADEIARAQWFSRAELATAVRDGQVVPPHRISIARSLIEQWFGGPIDAGMGDITHRSEQPVAPTTGPRP